MFGFVIPANSSSTSLLECRHELMFLSEVVRSSIALWALSLGTSDRAENIARSYREFLRTIDSCSLSLSDSQPSPLPFNASFPRRFFSPE